MQEYWVGEGGLCPPKFIFLHGIVLEFVPLY